MPSAKKLLAPIEEVREFNLKRNLKQSVFDDVNSNDNPTVDSEEPIVSSTTNSTANSTSVSTTGSFINLKELAQVEQFKPDISQGPKEAVCTSFLQPGAQFRGNQMLGTKSHEVCVTLKHVDLETSLLNGYLEIHNLTDSEPEITTFFEAEIISEKHNFLSRRVSGSLALNDSVDIMNWSRFPLWKANILPKITSSLNNSDHIWNHKLKKLSYSSIDDDSDSHIYVHKDFLAQRYVYMRWKELFLVPDATCKLDGASYDGIYYTCLDQVTGKIFGYYYHNHPEEQYIELDHIEKRTSQGYEFF